MRSLTSGPKAWLGRRLLQRSQDGGVDLSKLTFVPKRLLMPLRRNGVDPDPRLARTRETEPVFRIARMFGLGIWVVTGHEETRTVLADRTSYSNDIRPMMGARGASDGDIGGLGFTDPPEHTRLRKLLTPEFTMRRLERLRPTIDAIVEQQLDVLEQKGPEVDLVEHFAFPIPFLVICELLGLPHEDRGNFQELGHARFDVSYGGVGTLGAISESREFLMEATRKQRQDPGDGLIGKIIQEVGDDISDWDLGGLADGVFTGGFETTASMISLGALTLLRDGDAYERLRVDDDAIDPTVEELLRYLSVVQIAFPRFAKQDMDLYGKRIRKGDVVVCSLSGADRDARLGPGLEEFDPERPPVPHFAFGHGFHRCLGAELARMELRAAYPRLARRFPDLKLACDPGDLSFHDLSIVYGLDQLPVSLR